MLFRRLAFGAIATCFLATLVFDAAARTARAEKPVDFTREVRPILSNRCFACHGPDEAERQADLRLDDRASAIAMAIVPGKADESELVRRITSSDPNEQMPPSGSKKPPLTAEEIELLRRWIDQGAKYDAHWAFVPPRRPAVPEVHAKDWPANDIDRFILARLEAEKLPPAVDANPRTLARRLSFDLTGLPPRPEDVAALVADASPAATEKYVDKLLASPHYGERMAQFWLDQVRFADTNGIHGDNHQEHALFRDYVIEAFNANKPFDQFTIEQLAGDLLPGTGREQRMASAYNRLNMVTREGGAQPKEYMAKYAADRVRNASSVWLGATMACCECHTHKFDPFTIRDFYSFAAFFADIEETAVGVQPPTPLPTAAQEAQLKQFDEQIAAVDKLLNTATPELAAAQQAWEEELQKNAAPWNVFKPLEAKSAGGAELKIDADGTIIVSGASPPADSYTITATTSLKGITALRLDVLAHKSLPAEGPGRAENGNFVLNEIELLAPDAIGDPSPAKLQNASATFEQAGGFLIEKAIDGKADAPGEGWAVHGQIGKDQQAVFELARDVGDGSEITLTVILRQNYGSQHTIGRFRLAATNAPRPVKAQAPVGLPNEIAAILQLPVAQRSPAQAEQLAAYYRSIAPVLAPARAERETLAARRQALADSVPKLIIAKALATPREVRVLPRGNWLDDSGELVLPAVPAFMKQIETSAPRATRLDLARWLVDADNPLTARVIVNRYWKLLFGRGLVATLEDFGAQGSPPSHPALLDWLAVELRESGWNTKHILKLMALSRVYRLSSVPTAEQLERDPVNVLLSRQNRFRLDAEFIRDNALSISGLLVLKVGGESVKPYQPAGYWRHLNFPKREYAADHGESLYRRGLYTYWCRTFLHPSLLAFDAPSRESCTVERARSNTPLQSLVLLNDPTYVEAARKFAERIISLGGATDRERLFFAFGQALNREPGEREVAILSALLEKHRAQFAADPAAAAEVQKVGEAPTAPQIDAAELAAWTSVARAILNLHETITRN